MWFDETKELLGSRLRITFELDSVVIAQGLLRQIWEKLEFFQKKYSRFIPGNYLERMNRHIGEWQHIDGETYDHLVTIQNLKEKYPFHFSLAVKKHLDALGYDSRMSFHTVRHTDVDVGDRMKINGEEQILLEQPDKLFLSDPVEFGGFGKGYALDLAAGVLRDQAENICLDFGGDLYAQGKNQHGKAWTMALENPLKQGEVIGSLILDRNFLATSGTHQRKWGNKLQFHHLIDPKTGIPASYWAGSSILASSGLEADFLATALFCTPQEEIAVHEERLSQVGFLLIDWSGRAFAHNFPAELF